MYRRALSTVVLVTILFYGFLKPWFCGVYSIPISWFLELVGYDPDRILTSLNSFSLASNYNDHYLGWFIYYPTYLMLHLIFIFTLFNQKRKVRNKVALGLIVLVSFLIIIIMFSKYSGLNSLYLISYKLFQNLFSLPFILLAIEGGKTLINDVDKLMGAPKYDK